MVLSAAGQPRERVGRRTCKVKDYPSRPEAPKSRGDADLAVDEPHSHTAGGGSPTARVTGTPGAGIQPAQDQPRRSHNQSQHTLPCHLWWSRIHGDVGGTGRSAWLRKYPT